MGLFDWWFFKPRDPYFDDIDNILQDFENDSFYWGFNSWNNIDRPFRLFPNYVVSPSSYFPNIFRFRDEFPSIFNDEFEKKIQSHFEKRMGDIKGYRSVEIKSMLGPDGIMEKIEKIRNKDGSKRVKIIKRKGNKDYIIEKFIDKNGKEEVKESITDNDQKPSINKSNKNLTKPVPAKEQEVWTVPENMFNTSRDNEVLSC
ncbi:uncharacterized protein LOC143202339 [Rhynchophorus ferrugineus]|uniref:Uncharacterized protein n=1 Tax=Rhynchophorus ferrugineus TaxID=354439 RepID=A0A834MKE3_RHYFE|nr:hypothetical protein GWI33_000525 [Rhynchophorus ferrugineus]